MTPKCFSFINRKQKVKKRMILNIGAIRFTILIKIIDLI